MRSDWSSGQPADLEPLLDDLDRQRLEIDRRELTWATGAALVVASGEHQRYGFSNPVDWLRIRCRMGEGAVRDRICVGQQRRHLAASVAALEAGAIGFGHLVLIAQTRQALDRRRKGPLIFDELKLLGRAGDETVGRFFYTC